MVICFGSVDDVMDNRLISRLVANPLGFSSDIGSSIAVDDIFEKLKETWEVPLNRGSKVLALTVPRATVDSSLPKLVQQRNAVNDRIKSYSADGL